MKLSHLGAGIARLQRLPRLVAARLLRVGLSASPFRCFSTAGSLSPATAVLRCVCASLRRVFSRFQPRWGGTEEGCRGWLRRSLGALDEICFKRSLQVLLKCSAPKSLRRGIHCEDDYGDNYDDGYDDANGDAEDDGDDDAATATSAADGGGDDDDDDNNDDVLASANFRLAGGIKNRLSQQAYQRKQKKNTTYHVPDKIWTLQRTNSMVYFSASLSELTAVLNTFDRSRSRCVV